MESTEASTLEIETWEGTRVCVPLGLVSEAPRRSSCADPSPIAKTSDRSRQPVSTGSRRFAPGTFSTVASRGGRPSSVPRNSIQSMGSSSRPTRTRTFARTFKNAVPGSILIERHHPADTERITAVSFRPPPVPSRISRHFFVSPRPPTISRLPATIASLSMMTFFRIPARSGVTSAPAATCRSSSKGFRANSNPESPVSNEAVNARSSRR